jgi:hypothetical protein
MDKEKGRKLQQGHPNFRPPRLELLPSSIRLYLGAKIRLGQPPPPASVSEWFNYLDPEGSYKSFIGTSDLLELLPLKPLGPPDPGISSPQATRHPALSASRVVGYISTHVTL